MIKGYTKICAARHRWVIFNNIERKRRCQKLSPALSVRMHARLYRCSHVIGGALRAAVIELWYTISGRAPYAIERQRHSLLRATTTR